MCFQTIYSINYGKTDYIFVSLPQELGNSSPNIVHHLEIRLKNANETQIRLFDASIFSSKIQ